MAIFSYGLVFSLIPLYMLLFFEAIVVWAPKFRSFSFDGETLYLYQRFDLLNPNFTDSSHPKTFLASRVIKPYDVDLIFMWKLSEQLDDNSKDKKEILEEIRETTYHGAHLYASIDFIGKLIFGSMNSPSILRSVRPSDQPLVDDWDCLKSMIRIFESHCGLLISYGPKHIRAFANICNRNVAKEDMERASVIVCEGYNITKWSPLIHGYSA